MRIMVVEKNGDGWIHDEKVDHITIQLEKGEQSPPIRYVGSFEDGVTEFARVLSHPDLTEFERSEKR